jgi:acetyltransferase
MQDGSADRHPDSCVRLRDGTAIVIRPVRPEDAALYPDFAAAITPEDVRMRFFAPVRPPQAESLARLTQLDPATAAAFVALDEGSGRLLGIARLHYENGADGEYGILVRSSLQGRGIGWMLMTRLIDHARARGLRQMHGLVLAENTTMLAMCRELGFHIANDARERGVKRATLRLS